MDMEKEMIMKIYKVAKVYESSVLSAEDLFQIGFIGYMKGEQSGFTGEELIKSIRNEIEVFLKAQSQSTRDIYGI